MSQVKTKDLNDLEKTSVSVNYIVAAVLLYYGVMGAMGSRGYGGLMGRTDSMFQILVGVALALLASSQLFVV